MRDEPTTLEEEFRSLRVILKRAEKLTPDSRRWLIARLEALDGDGPTLSPRAERDGFVDTVEP